MTKRILDVRLAIFDTSSDEDKELVKLMDKLKQITGVERDTEILKACIRKAYEHYYKQFEK